MAWTNVGFDGTINEAQWSSLSTLMGQSGGGYLAAGNGDCLATAVSGSRAVSVAAGSLYGDGVLSTNSGAETVAMTTPVNGQWYVIALRRTWATNTAALVAIAGATTTTTTPTAPPTSFPTLNTNQGVLTDQPIAWAWCNSANTTVVVYDIRLKGVKSTPPVVANQNERDAKFMTPTQGLQVWRDDLGAVETYFGLYNASTNPGGRDAAGWYTTNRANGLVPLRPTTITAVSGTATINALNTVTFTNVTSVNLAGLFSSAYTNYFVEVTFNGTQQTISGFRLSAGGSAAGANYFFSGTYSITTANPQSWGTSGNNAWWTGNSNALNNGIQATIQEPNLARRSKIFWQQSGNSGVSYDGVAAQGLLADTSVYDGIMFLPNAGSVSGEISVYGISK